MLNNNSGNVGGWQGSGLLLGKCLELSSFPPPEYYANIDVLGKAVGGREGELVPQTQSISSLIFVFFVPCAELLKLHAL
jgi:hypothetical protein